RQRYTLPYTTLFRSPKPSESSESELATRFTQSLQRRKRGRHQDTVGDRGDDRAVGFGFCARLDPFRIGGESGELLVAIGQRFPRSEEHTSELQSQSN